MNYLFVSLGAALGGVVRYWFGDFVHKLLPSFFPFGTLFINIIGSFLLGVFIFYFDERELLSQPVKLFLTIGFCGGFTTFSTFSFETIKLLLDSEFILASVYIIASVFLSILGVYLAYILSR
ncbi:MAG: fluoride efflux transporter CrcB [Ignavibacteria bacterium]|nr:fluoride efflux transporter CrcB [Ignavibacteria bacterium]